MDKIHIATERAYKNGYEAGKRDALIQGKWNYFYKQNIAVCTNCNFERDLDANFGRAISCPNCGAKMRLGKFL